MYRFYSEREARQSRSMPDHSPTKIHLPRRARNYSDNTSTHTFSLAEAMTDVEGAHIQIQPSGHFDESIDTDDEVGISPLQVDWIELNARYRDNPSADQVVQGPYNRPPATDYQNYPPYSQLLDTEHIAAGQNLQYLLERADAENWGYERLGGELGLFYNLGLLSARLLNVGMLAAYRHYSAEYHAFGFQYYMRCYLREHYDLWRQELEAEIQVLILRADLPPSIPLQVHGNVPLQRQIGLSGLPPRGNETHFLAALGYEFVVIQDYILDRYEDGSLNLDELRMEIRILLREFQFDPVDERDLGMRIRNILVTRYYQRCVYFSQQLENGVITREVLIETLRPLFLTFHLDLDPSWQQQFNAEMNNTMSEAQRRAQRNRLLGQQMMLHHQRLQQQARQNLPADQVADQDPVPSYQQATLPPYSSVQHQAFIPPQAPSYNDDLRSPPVQMPPLFQFRPGQGPFPPTFSPTMQAQLDGMAALLSTNPTSRVNKGSVLEGPQQLARRSRSEPRTFGQSEAMRVQEEEEARLMQPEDEYPCLQPSRGQLPVFGTTTATSSRSGSPEYLSDDGAVFPISIGRASRHAPAQEEDIEGEVGPAGGSGVNEKEE